MKPLIRYIAILSFISIPMILYAQKNEDSIQSSNELIVISNQNADDSETQDIPKPLIDTSNIDPDIKVKEENVDFSTVFKSVDHWGLVSNNDSNDYSSLDETSLPQVLSLDGFDNPSLRKNVKQAQLFYGLYPDGKYGVELKTNLMVKSTEVNQELKDFQTLILSKLNEFNQSDDKNKFGHFIIFVNIPSFTLHLINTDTGLEVLQSKVIVGSPRKQTPIFQTNVVNLKYNPDWNPPLDLAKYGAKYVAPGLRNPLGVLRFSTDNNIGIYLHDTDGHYLFNRSVRALSHGCMRVQRWDDLASELSHLSLMDVYNQVNKIDTHYIGIHKVKVYTTYFLTDSIYNPKTKSFKRIHYQDIYKKFGS